MISSCRRHGDVPNLSTANRSTNPPYRVGSGVTVERLAELGTRRDSELGEDPVEVGADRAVRQVELLADLPVGQAVRGQPGNLELLRAEPVGGRRVPAVGGLSGGAQLLKRP